MLNKVTEQYFHFFIENLKNYENKRKLEKMTILPSGSAGSFKHNESIFNKIIQPMYWFCRELNSLQNEYVFEK